MKDDSPFVFAGLWEGWKDPASGEAGEWCPDDDPACQPGIFELVDLGFPIGGKTTLGLPHGLSFLDRSDQRPRKFSNHTELESAKEATKDVRRN